MSTNQALLEALRKRWGGDISLHHEVGEKVTIRNKETEAKVNTYRLNLYTTGLTKLLDYMREDVITRQDELPPPRTLK